MIASKYRPRGKCRRSRFTFSRSPSVTIANPAERLRTSFSHSSDTPETKRTRVSKSSHPSRKMKPASLSHSRIPRSRNTFPMTEEANSNSRSDAWPGERGIARDASEIHWRTIAESSGRRAGYLDARFAARETNSSLRSTRVSPKSNRTKGFVIGPPSTGGVGSKAASLPPLHVFLQAHLRTEGTDHPVVVVVRRMVHLLAHRARLLKFEAEGLAQQGPVVGTLQEGSRRQASRDHRVSEAKPGHGILESTGLAREQRAISDGPGNRIRRDVRPAEDPSHPLPRSDDLPDPGKIERLLGPREEPVEVELAPGNAVHRVEPDPWRDREVASRGHLVVEQRVGGVPREIAPGLA